MTSALACGPDNRMVGPDGWTTRLTDRHDVEWIPPPRLDTGQPRINHYHRPEKLRPAPDDALGPVPSATNGERVIDEPSASNDAQISDDPSTDNDPSTTNDNTTHQSGPDPPDGKAA